MMKIRFMSTLGAMAIMAITAGTTQATVLTFETALGNNQDLVTNHVEGAAYGSNKGVADDTVEFETTGPSGATPNIALNWGPTTANVLEFHNSTNWIAPMTGKKLQFDVDLSSQTVFPAAPTVDFVPDAGFAAKINSLIIGTARDQHIFDTHEPASDWQITVTGSTQGLLFDHTTTALGLATQGPTGLGTGAAEVVNIDITGLPGETLTLLFNDFGDDSLLTNHDGTIGNHPRGGIDTVSFSQVVPEPSTFALLVLCGLAGIATRRRS